MPLNRRRLVLAAALLALAPLAHAQGFPDRPLKIIYTYSPGGTGDTLTRSLADGMSRVLGQPVVVENRTGAQGTIGVIAGAKAAPDGYTMMVTTITTVVQTPFIAKDAGFDPITGLTPIANLAVTPLVLLAHPSLPANDFPAFVQWARKQEKGVDMAVAGPTLQVANALLAKETDIKIVNVMYRGNAPALQSVLAGDAKLFFSTPSAQTAEFVRQGKMKVLGVTSAEPSPLVPGGVPISKFIPGYVQDINFAIWAPPGTPREVAAKLTEAVMKATAEAGMAEKFHGMGTTLKPAPGAEVTRIAQREAKNIKTIMETTEVKFGD